MVKRKEYLDVLKILAVFLVYFNHTGTKGYDLLIGKVGGAVSLIIWLLLAIIIGSFAIYTVKYVLSYITTFLYKFIKS